MAAYQLEDVLISYLFQTLEIPGKRLRRWRDSGELVHRALVELAEFEAYCEVRPDIGPLVKAYKSQAWSNKEAGKIETSSIELVRSTRRFTKGSGETEDEGAPEEPGRSSGPFQARSLFSYPPASCRLCARSASILPSFSWGASFSFSP